MLFLFSVFSQFSISKSLILSKPCKWQQRYILYISYLQSVCQKRSGLFCLWRTNLINFVFISFVLDNQLEFVNRLENFIIFGWTSCFLNVGYTLTHAKSNNLIVQYIYFPSYIRDVISYIFFTTLCYAMIYIFNVLIQDFNTILCDFYAWL